MSMIRIDRLTEHTLTRIFDDVYSKINQDYIDVFLCGGASNPKNPYIRDKVREMISSYKNIRTLYPEDMFIEIMNRDKKSDLLTLEKFLADNCDFICIICESAGSLVELGAFTNNKSTINKVIAVIEDNKKRDKSFIMLGPIKVIRKKDKNKVIFYNKNDIEDLSNKLRRIISPMKSSLKSKPVNKSLDTITGLYFFIPLLLYFYRLVEVASLISILKFVFRKKNLNDNKFDVLFRSSIKLLHKEKLLQKNIINEKPIYSLTNTGYQYISNILNCVNIKNRTMLYDSIRFGIMNRQLYKQHRFP